MTDTSKTEIKFDAIANALGSRMLSVPQYQRAYAWERGHVQQYFDDLRAAINDNEPEYFLGSIVSTTGGEREEVVDGQQRLATTIILLAAIRDYFVDNKDEERASQIESEYLFRKALRTQEIMPRLHLNDSDNSFFTSRVLERVRTKPAKPSKPSHEKIDAAADLAHAFVRSIAKDTKVPADRLADLVEFLSERVKIVWLRAADTANAFVIFETLNDRGLDLAISDLLKNYLFLTSENRISEVQASWTSMLATLESSPGELNVTEFIRHLWSSHNGATRERELYSAIKKTVRSKQAAIELAKSLEAGAGVYAAIVATEHSFWNEYGATAREHMATLNLLGMVQIRPLLLAVLEVFNVKEARASLKLMVSWGVRLLIVGGLGGGTMEDHYAGAACKVRDKLISTATGLNKALGKVIPADSVFRDAFAVARVSRSTLARYYLRALELVARDEENPELVPNPNQEKVDLEHVLPKIPGAEWTFDEEEHRAYVTRLGNLVLLKSSENSTAGNVAYSVKKPVLKASKFKLTSMAASGKEWTAEAIDKRQARLAELALKAWALK